MILDVCVGKGMMYRGNHKYINNFITNDRRIGTFTLPEHVLEWGYTSRDYPILPTTNADMKYLPYRDHLFHLIIFDPPHYKMGKNSIFNIKYGSWDKEEYIRTFHYINKEFHRILIPQGILLTKILDIDHRRKQTIRHLTNFQLLLSITQHPTSTGGGIATPKRHKTYWLVFVAK